MSNIFFIGDTHFGHKNIIKWSEYRSSMNLQSLEDHDEWLIDMWNSVVSKRDVVYHMGDVAFGRPNVKKVMMLNGIKKLILGNHDTYPIDDYLEAGFSSVYGAKVYKDFILTHVPVHESQLEYRWKYNIHGHIHNAKEYDLDNRYINVNIDGMASAFPISLDQIYDEIKRREDGE